MHDSGDGGSLAYGLYLAQSLVALAAVGVVTIAARRWITRWRPTGPASAGLRIVERVTVEPRRSLYLVEGGDVRLLLASSERGLHVLHRWSPVPRSGATALPRWHQGRRTPRLVRWPHRGQTTDPS